MNWPRRSVLVLALLLIAFSVPFFFWFTSGSREASRQSQLIVYSARNDALLAADATARRLRMRLEGIRDQESQRPYFHYQNLFHDPRGASQGLAVVPSPLAQGPGDPLISAHFQIDERGKVTLPTLNEDLSELNAPDVRKQGEIRDNIRAVAPAALRAAAPALTTIQAEALSRRKKREPEPQQPANVLRLEPQVFAQNSQSNIVYSELKSKSAAKARIPPKSAPEVEIVTGDFFWTTLEVAGTRSLAALRPVVTPNGSFVQGFIISRNAMSEALGPAAASLRVRPASMPSTRVVPIGKTGWAIEINESAATARASDRATLVDRTFRQTFYAGAGAVLLTLGAVSLLVWRTEKLARERAQFASAAAQELRTPLAGLRLYGDMLANELGDRERTKHYGEQVAREADRLGRVVSNMLEFTRLERGSLSIRPQPGDLAGSVHDCVEQLRPALEAAGCHVTFTAVELARPVAFDRDALHHIVQNLVDNAERYSRASEERTIEIAVTNMNGGAAVIVSDRGVGIDAKVARHLFLPFERGTQREGPSGLGLGLVLVKALVHAHGGKVSWSARTGGGTTFSVMLPASS